MKPTAPTSAPSRRKRLVSATLVLVVGLLGLAWLARGPAPEAASSAHQAEGRTGVPAGSATVIAEAGQLVFRTGLEALPDSLQGTEVGGELEVDAQGRLKLTRGLRVLFDYFLSASGEEPAPRQRERVRAYITQRLGGHAAAREQALALFDSYLAYKQELERALSHSRATSLADMQARLGAVGALRARHFEPEVVAAFFGEDQAYDQYTLARFAILNDASLSPAQKAARVAELRAGQPAAVRQQMDVVETAQTLETLTAAWQQRAGSPGELRELRETLVGRDAADRLESLDRQTEAWDSRVAAYLQQRAQILGDATLAESMRRQQVDALRNGAFTGAERIRIETIERIQDPAARDAASVSRLATPG